MPHIRALFLEDDDVIALLVNYRTKIREIVSTITGYASAKIAFFPDMVPAAQAALCDNLLPLEFVIDTGIACTDLSETQAENIRDTLVSQIPELSSINFGIWLRVMTDNGFSEHRVQTE